MKDYFSQSDFDKTTPPCRKDDIHSETLRKFNAAREVAGIPFIPTSAARTPEHEKKQGRPGTSSHVFTPTKKCRAMDIKAISSGEKWIIVQALIAVGFTRIGIAQTFIHADDDPDKPGQVIWTY